MISFGMLILSVITLVVVLT
ncbi:putative holin-like toxin [Leuconostoc lactis]|nr:putative holin-like toxin [Leuconostoc lactis]